jgi:anti-sigma B factor antagonist
MAEASPIRVRQEGALTRVEFTERSIIDEVVIQRIGQEVLHAVETQAVPKLLMDFSGVQHLSSAALGVLITVNGKVKTKGGKMALCQIAKPIFEVFRITKLDKLFQVHDSADAASKSLA